MTDNKLMTLTWLRLVHRCNSNVTDGKPWQKATEQNNNRCIVMGGGGDGRVGGGGGGRWKTG